MANQLVNPIPATPPMYGLLMAAPSVPDTTPPERWQDGWVFNPENCGTSGRVALNCTGNTAAMADGATNPADATGTPFVVWAWDRCSTLGLRDFEGRARRQLLATESYQVANELWTGDLRDSIVPPAKELENLALTDLGSDTVTSGVGGVAPDAALALLVGALSSCGMGTRGMIHVTPQMLQALVTSDSVALRDGLWQTPMGHIVVADGGYDGTGPGGTPAGSTQWAYATSMIYTRLSEIIVPANFVESVDRAVNTATVYAQRLAGFMWDGCCHFAAEVTLQVPIVGAPS